MGKIDVSKNTVVKSTPETFELIKALFKANGVVGGITECQHEYIGAGSFGYLKVGKTTLNTEITLQELAFDSLPAPEWATMIAQHVDGGYVWLEHNKKGLSTKAKHLNGGYEGDSWLGHKWHEAEVVLKKNNQPTTANYPG